MINRLLIVLAALFAIGVITNSMVTIAIVVVALVFLLLDSMAGGPIVRLDYEIAVSNMMAAEAAEDYDDPS